MALRIGHPPAPTVCLNKRDVIARRIFENPVVQPPAGSEIANYSENVHHPSARIIDYLSDRPAVAIGETLHPVLGNRLQNVGDMIDAAHPVERPREFRMIRVDVHRVGFEPPSGTGTATNDPLV